MRCRMEQPQRGLLEQQVQEPQARQTDRHSSPVQQELPGHRKDQQGRRRVPVQEVRPVRGPLVALEEPLS